MSERYPFSDSLADEINYRRYFGEMPEKLRVLFHSLPDTVTNGNGITEALGVWQGYPILAEIIMANETDPGARQELWSQLDAAHYQAARKLADLVEREGMDSTGIHRSQEICQRFFHKCEGAPIMHPDRLYDTWPHCVSDHNNELAEGERTAIREADALVRRLATRLEAKADAALFTTPANLPTKSSSALVVKGDAILLDGQPVSLDMTPDKADDARHFLAVIAAKGGQWISGPEIGQASQSGFRTGVRWDRVRKSLPEAVRSRIESNRKLGYRLMT